MDLRAEEFAHLQQYLSSKFFVCALNQHPALENFDSAAWIFIATYVYLHGTPTWANVAGKTDKRCSRLDVNKKAQGQLTMITGVNAEMACINKVAHNVDSAELRASAMHNGAAILQTQQP